MDNPPIHAWLREIRVAWAAGPTSPLLDRVGRELLERFGRWGHQVQPSPTDDTDVILTTARFGEPLGWREALLFTSRARFKLTHSPTVYTLIQISPNELAETLERLRAALEKKPPDPVDFEFAGMAPQAYQVFVEQGSRGGPMLALERLVQAQAKCIRVLLVVGDDRPLTAYHFDLVGGYPCSDGVDLDAFYDDIVLRIVTTVSTREVTQHEVAGELIPHAVWQGLTTPKAMHTAARELGERNFFTDMVRIADLVSVPAVSNAIASQYSEGCFATWDPTLDALIATVTGSAHPVDKGDITEEDLAVIVGVRPDREGALVRHVEGKPNIPPSSEAVEMMEVDQVLPKITLGIAGQRPVEVPVVRSKLHGHRGIAAYDPQWVEYVPLPAAFHHYPVSCATAAQARGIITAFALSEALRNPDDPRQVVFTVLPCHGTVIVERWVPATAPFQVVWEYMDAGYLEVESAIPQEPVAFAPGPDGRMRLSIL